MSKYDSKPDNSTFPQICFSRRGSKLYQESMNTLGVAAALLVPGLNAPWSKILPSNSGRREAKGWQQEPRTQNQGPTKDQDQGLRTEEAFKLK